MFGYIYKTTNLVNGKIYIGQKKSSKFLDTKYLGSGKRLHEAINKYGKDLFKVELIEEIESEELMDIREIFWINFYKSTDNNIGYNLSTGGNTRRCLVGSNNGFFGKHHSEETKLYLSKIRKGKKHRPKTAAEKEHMSKKMTGRIITEEARIKLSNNAKINPNYGMRGKHMSEETKEKIIKTKRNCGAFGQTKNYIHITNGQEDKMIPQNKFLEYQIQGWIHGRKKFSKKACENISNGHKGQKAHNKNKIWINNKIINKTIYREELEDYIKDGWIKGMKPKN